MRDDIPFAWPQRELTRLYFPACCVAVGALIGVLSPSPQWPVMGALLLAMALCSIFLSGYQLHAGLIITFVPLSLLTGSAGLLLFALCPLAFLTLPVIAGRVAIVLYALTPTATYFARTGDAGLALGMYLPLGIGSIVVTLLVATLFLRTRALTRELATARERQRLAGEIHDTVAQGLSSVVMLLEAALVADADTARRHITLAMQTARENLGEARALVGALTPVPLEGTSLMDALKRLAATRDAEFTVTGTTRALPTGVEVMLLRIAQEALTNVQRHARALNVGVTLDFTQTHVALEIRDDGVGFSTDRVLPGYGLGGMRSRVDQAGGRLTIHSGPGEGTMVRTEIEA